jgi:hypothetical protein
MIRANTFLLFAARRKVNGANVHKTAALIRGYELALELATDPRCKNRPEARRHVGRAEQALRTFCEVGK